MNGWKRPLHMRLCLFSSEKNTFFSANHWLTGTLRLRPQPGSLLSTQQPLWQGEGGRRIPSLRKRKAGKPTPHMGCRSEGRAGTGRGWGAHLVLETPRECIGAQWESSHARALPWALDPGPDRLRDSHLPVPQMEPATGTCPPPLTQPRTPSRQLKLR